MADQTSLPKAMQLSDIRSLPSRPASELPSFHCTLPGKQYSFLPMKHRAETMLPPMQLLRTHSEGGFKATADHPRRTLRRVSSTSRARTGVEAGEAAVHSAGSSSSAKCCGDYCHAQVRYPSSLLDLDSSDDPWLVEARRLCSREAPLSEGLQGRGNMLFTAEEIVSCLQTSSPSAPKLSATARSCGSGGTVCTSWILEARSCPSLCSWLGAELGWMFNPRDATLVAEAAHRLREDADLGTTRTVAPCRGMSALRYRLKSVPVCATCLGIYTAIHRLVTMVRVHRKDLWAESELFRREYQEQEAKEQERQKEIEWLQEKYKQRCQEKRAFDLRSESRQNSRSLFLEPSMQDWLHNLDESRVPSSRDTGSVLSEDVMGHDKRRRRVRIHDSLRSF